MFSRLKFVLIGLVLVWGASFGQAQVIDSGKKAEILEALAKTLRSNAYVPGIDFTKIDEYLKEQEKAIDQARTEEEFRLAISNSLKNFKFSHIVFFSPRMVAARKENKTVGIGVLPSRTPDGLLITRVFPSSPADELGIRAGDTIQEINGDKADYNLLLGEEGSSITIKIKRFDGKIEFKSVTRRKYSTVRNPSVMWSDTDTAVLTLPTFDLTYDRGVIEGLVESVKTSQNLVIDLRNNPGGAVVNMNHFLSLFMPESSPIGTLVSRRMMSQYLEENPGAVADPVRIASWSPVKIRTPRKPAVRYTGKIVVLINGASGSAAEIAAVALRESMGVKILGKKSAGAVLISTTSSLPYNFMIQYPITDFVTLKGLRLEGLGVTPDVICDEPQIMRPGAPDEPLIKAIAFLHEGDKQPKN